MELKIEKGVPLKGINGNSTAVSEAMRTMEVGDSFVIPTFSSSQRYLHKPRKFAVRKVDGGFRVWRIA